MIFKILSGLLLALVPGLAFAEPITLSALIASTNSVVLGTAAFIGINLAIAWVAGKILAPDVDDARDKDRKKTITSGIEPRRIVYGEAYNSGPLVYLNTTGDSNQYLHMIVALATHPSDEISELHVNDEVFSLTDSNYYDGTGTDINNYYVTLDDKEPQEKKRRFKNRIVCVPITGRWMYGNPYDEGDIDRRSLIPNFIQAESGADSSGIDSVEADRLKVVVTDPTSTLFDEVEIVKVYSDSQTVTGVLTNSRHYYTSGYYFSGIPAGGTFKVWFGSEEVTGSNVTYSVSADEFSFNTSAVNNGVTISIDSEGEYTVSGEPTQETAFTVRAVYNGITVDRTYTILKSFAYNTIETGDHFKSVYLTVAPDQAFRYTANGSPLGPSDIQFNAAVEEISGENLTWDLYAWELNFDTGEYEWVLKPGVIDNISNTFRMEEGNMVTDSGVQGNASLSQNMPWNENQYRLDRCTYVYVRVTSDDKTFSGNIPNIAVKMKGKRIYNPLQDRTFIDNATYVGATGKPFRDRGAYNVSSSYVVGDLVTNKSYVCIRPNTGQELNNHDYWLPAFPNLLTDSQQYLWAYSNNWALTALDYLLDPFYGLNLDVNPLYNELDWTTALNAVKDSYDGGYLDRPNNTIVASRFTNEEAISLLFPKLSSDGVLDTGTTPIQNLETLFTGGNGELAYSQGQHSLYAGVYREAEGNPAVDYSIVVDESYLAGDSISLDTAIPNSDLFNIVQGVYIDNDNKGEPTEFAPIYGEDYIAEDGQEYIIDVDYPMTTNYFKAALLGIQTLEKGRLNETLSFTCNFKIFKYKVGDIIFVKNDLLGYNENVFPSQLNAVDSYKQFKIISMDIKENLEVDVTVQEISYKPYNPDFVWNIPPENELPRYLIGDVNRGVLRPDNLAVSPIYIKEISAGISYHFTDVTWLGPLAESASEIGFDLIDEYQIRYTPVGENIFDEFSQETTTVPVVLRATFIDNKLSAVTIENTVEHYGYWADGEIEVNTSFVGFNANQRAVVKYTALGNGKMEISEILSQGSNYTNGTNVLLSSQDIPRPKVANPGFSSDNVHVWKQSNVAANNSRREHDLELLLEDGTQDYIVGVRARAGNQFSNWISTSVRGGDAIPNIGIKIIRVTSDSLGFTFDEQGNPTAPASGIITYTATSATVDPTDIVFEVEASDGGATLTDNLDGTATMSLAQFGTSTWARIRARHVTLPNIYDVVVTYKLQGKDGQPAVYGSVESNGPFTYIFADGSWNNTFDTILTATFFEGDAAPVSRQITVQFDNGVLSGLPTAIENGITATIYGDNSNVYTAAFTYKSITIAATVQALRDGETGYSTVVLQAYKRSATIPTDTPGALTYTFATDSWTPANGWERTIPSGAEQLYIISTVVTANTSTYNVLNTDWNTPRAIMERGPRGYNTAIVNAYKRSTSFPLDNPGQVTYDFNTRLWIPDPSNGWESTVPAGTDQLYVTSATAYADGDTDIIGAAEWSTPVGILSDGFNAATVFIYKRTNTAGTPTLHTGDSTYTFETSTLSLLNNDWFNFIPDTGGEFLWVRTATAVSQGDDDTILNSEWSNVSLLTRPGVDAEYVIVNGTQVFKYLAGASIPENETIILSATLFGGLTTYTWEYWNGSSWVALSGTNTGSSYSLAYNNAAWGAETFLRIRCLSDNGKYDEITISKLFDAEGGQTTFVALLSNPTHNVPSDFDGANRVFSDSGTIISAYEGATQLEYVTGTGFPGTNSQFTVERIDFTGGVASADPITKDVLNAVVPSITAMTGDTGSILFAIKITTGTGANVTTYATQTFALAKGGVDGAPPKYVVVNGEQVFKFLPGQSIPEQTSIILNAELYGDLTVYAWEYWDGATWTALSGTNNTAIYTLAYNNAAWGTIDTLRVRCWSATDIYDELTIVKLYDAVGGQSAFNATLSNETHTLPLNTTTGAPILSDSGTLISAYEGVNQLQFVTEVGFPTVNETFTVERTAYTGGITSTNGITVNVLDASVPNITAMTGDTGSILYTIRIRGNAGNTVTIKKLQTFNKGINAQYVVVNGEQAFKFLGGNTIPINSPISLSAALYGGLTAYLWQHWNGSGWSNLSTPNTASAYSLAYNNAAWGTKTTLRVRCLSGDKYDEISIVKLVDGANAFTVSLNNQTHAISVDKNGVPLTYTGSGTRIKAYEGTTPLTYETGTGTPNTLGKFRVTFTRSNVSAVDGSGSIPLNNGDALTNGINGFTADTGAISFTINIRSSTGTAVSIPTQQTFSKTYPGEDGQDGVAVSLSNPSHTVPCTENGTPITLANSGTRISVAEGGTALQYVTGTSTPGTNGRFTVTFTTVGVASNSTSGNIATSVKDALVANLVSFTAASVGVINYTIRVRTTTGNVITLTAQQSFSKSKDGGEGPPGESVTQLIVYRRASSTPATPTGGSFNFGTKVLTPPTGWAITVPTGTTDVYFSRASASVPGTTGTDSSLTWSTPALAAGLWTPITSDDLAAGLDIPIVHGGSQPAGVYLGSNLVYWTGGGTANRRMYRWTGSSYVNTASANDIVAGTIQSALTLSEAFVMSSTGKLYTKGPSQSVGKSTYASTLPGIFLGYDGGYHKLNIGDSTRFLRYDGTKLEVNQLSVRGSFVNDSALSINSARILTGPQETAPFVVMDYGTASDLTGTAVGANREVILGPFYSPTYSIGFYSKRLAYNKMDMVLEINAGARQALEYLQIAYQYDSLGYVAPTGLNHPFEGNNQGTAHGVIRFTTADTSWDRFWIKVYNWNRRCVHLSMKATVINSVKSANASNSYSTWNSGQTGSGSGSEPLPPGDFPPAGFDFNF